MTRLGDRHLGTAGGALRLGGKPLTVEIRLGRDAHLASVQHTAWMLLNLLCRLDGAVSGIRLSCPIHAPTIERLSPLVSDSPNLIESLTSTAQKIGNPSDGFVPVELCLDRASDVVIAVGFDYCQEATFCAVGNGLCGGVFSRSIAPPRRHSDLTIGPYLAASMAAGEVFRFVRLLDYKPERQLFLTALDYSHGPDPSWGALEPYRELRSVLLAGVGAVGCATLHALYPLALPGTILVADNDPKGIDKTNLGRYILFGSAAIGKQKASQAAKLLHRAEFRVVPHNGSFEQFFKEPEKPAIVLSAVDTNASRHALQEQYAPIIVSASTFNLRAEVLRCGPPSVGACLACFNPLETNQRTEEQIRSLLRERPEIVDRLSEKLHLNREEVAIWINEKRCSVTGERLVEELRTDDGAVPAFAVGFVSVLAGTFLAAELLKNLANHAGPLDEMRNRVVFQFQQPAAATNGSHYYPRDERCTVCSPENVGARIWYQRFEQFREANKSAVR